MRGRVSFLLLLLVTLLFAYGCSKSGEKGTDGEIEIDQSNFNEEGMPIANDPITLDFFASHSPFSAEDFNDVPILDVYEEMTNVKIDWEQVPMSDLEEKMNLALLSDELPDVFYGMWMSNNDVYKYSSEGAFIPLNDLIDKYAPNLSALLDEYPSIRKGLTFPDGNIYSFPTIYSPEFTSLLVGSKPWINEEWLDELGMDNPETTEDFYQYLKAVKGTDLIGDGKDNEIPYGESSNELDYLSNWLKGSFGIGNRGRLHQNVDVDPDTEELRFVPILDGYKEMLEYMHKLYSEELIEQGTFSNEAEQYLSNGASGLYGSTNFFDPVEMFGKEGGAAFTSGHALEGPNGHREYTGMTHPLYSLGQFMISKDNKHPAETVRWMDYLGFHDDGVKLFYMGIEGVTYEDTPDGPKLTEEITNNPDGLSDTQALSKYMIAPGGGHPTKIVSEYYSGADNSELELEATAKLEPYLIEEAWPNFTFSEDESKRLNAITVELDQYIREAKAEFITGRKSFSKWDAYVDRIEKMGLDEFMDIQQNAYERYIED